MSNNKRKLIDLTRQTELHRAPDGTVSASPVLCDWPNGRDWQSVADMARTLGVTALTAVDPGEVHMGIVRIQLEPEYRLTHWRILNLQTLCDFRSTVQPELKLTKTGNKFSIRSVLDTLSWYVRRESGNGSIFGSDLLVVESQDFKRSMKAIETVLITTFNCVKPLITVHPAAGGAVPAAQTISASSKCSCFGGLFPQLNQPSAKRRRFHGPGNVANDARQKAQYAQNKKCSRKWGALIAPYLVLERKLGPTYTAADRANMISHISKHKTDDIYDALFLALYAINTKLPAWSRRKRKHITAPIDGLKATALRGKRQFEEVRDLMRWLGVPEQRLVQVREALFSG